MMKCILLALCIVGSAAAANDESALMQLQQTAVSNPLSLLKVKLQVGSFPCDSKDGSYCTPHFFYNGAQKSGSVKFHEALTQNPAYIYNTKDRWGGSHPFRFHWKSLSTADPGHEKELEVCGRNNMESAYLKQFMDVRTPVSGNEVNTFTGEFGPNNFHCVCCPTTFKKLYPNSKHVVMLRNPFTRTVKRHLENLELQQRRSRLVGHTWAEWRDMRLPELKSCLAAATTEAESATCASGDSVFGWSTYVAFLKHWASQGYSPENLLVLYTDDWYTDPTAVMRKAESFLNMPAAKYDNAALMYGVGASVNASQWNDAWYVEHHGDPREAEEKRKNTYFKDDAGQEALFQHFRDSINELDRFCKEKGWQSPPAAWAQSLVNSASARPDFDDYQMVDDPRTTSSLR